MPTILPVNLHFNCLTVSNSALPIKLQLSSSRCKLIALHDIGEFNDGNLRSRCDLSVLI